MQSPPLRRGVPAQGAEAFTFETRLENEEATLDAMLTSMTRGALPPDAWERLHAAAQRDDRMSELAFAYESASQGKRTKALAPAHAAEFLFQAGRFFGDTFGDEVGAVTYLERSLALAPSHPAAFAKIEQLLRSAPAKLADLYASTAQHRPRGEQASLLRRAAELLSQVGGADDKLIELYQHVLKIHPGDEVTREKLEELCIKANRLRDLVRLSEQALSSEPPPDEPTRRRLLSRIVEVYADKLQEPERAMPHVEQLLAIDPASEQGRKVAQRLVVVKGLAGRAAAALANAYEAAGTPQDVARYITIELENTRGPKRAVLLARLGTLRQERLRDDAGAFEAFEQALAVDANDDGLRSSYVALAGKLGRFADAAKTLGRVLATVKSPEVKARVSAQLGETLLRGGDTKRAKAALTGVFGLADAPADAQLAAAYALSEIHEREGDLRALCEALERVSALEPGVDGHQAADERLAEVAMALGDSARAIVAYERLVSTSARAHALAALAPLYEKAADPEKHARLLEEQAKDATDPATARAQMMRAAEVRATSTSDAAAAILSCRAIVERFGPARDVHAIVVPLLETQRRWAELALALAEEAVLTNGTEHAEVMTRLGTLRMQRLADVAGAIAAFGDALSVDPNDKTARMMLEKLTVIGEHRLAAARVLEPLYRRHGASGPLLKTLELRGALAPDVDERLAALREAAELADGAETGRAADVVGRALADAVAHHRAVGEWLRRLELVAGPGTDPKRRATILGGAIGSREVTSDDLSMLAKLAAEAYAASGDAAAAIELYRRALSFEPHSTELLSRIDDLLRDQGSPRERIALYRAALARGGTARRRELLHRIGAIERHDLTDLAAAIETYRTALDDDADDADAQAELAELYEQAARWGDLCALLESRLARVEGDAARSTRAALAMVAAAHGDGSRARVHCALLLEDPALAPEHLQRAADAAATLGDPDLERAVLHRRAEMAGDPREQIGWLESLGDLDERRRGDRESAASAWKRAAALAESVGDDELARRLFWRACDAAPGSRDVTERLVALCERGGVWHELPPLYVSLAEQSSDDSERVELWLRTARVLSERLGDLAGAAERAALTFELAPTRADVLSTFEQLSAAAGATTRFEQAVDHALAHAILQAEPTRGADLAPRVQLLLARARVLAGGPQRADDAARAYRAILDEPEIDRAHLAGALAAFEALIAGDPGGPQRLADRRWLLEWRAEHAPEEEQVARLLDWAREEEAAFGDPSRALALHRRVLERDADCDESLSAVTRLALSTGDMESALSALRVRRERAEGPTRVAIDLEIARVLLSGATRWDEALTALRAVFVEAPGDAEARALAGQLLAHRPTRADTIQMVEQACDATDDVDARVHLLTSLLESPADPAEADARRGWFGRLCDLQREESDLHAAMATAVRAAGEMPEVSDLWDRAEALARALSRPEEMAALYEEVLARTLTREQTLRIGERAVQFYEEWFEDPARVVRVLERVLQLDPTADWAFDRLKLLLDAAERWDDLFALYDRALESASELQRTRLLEDAAQTAKDFADRPDRAIQYLERLNQLRPGDAKLTGALERLYERQGRHRELVALLTARLPNLKPDEARRTRSRVALLWLEELKDPSAALDALEPVLRAGEGASPADTTDLWPLLERVLAASPAQPEARVSVVSPRESERPPRSKRGRKSEAPAPPAVPVRQRTAGWLRQYYTASNRDADLIRMLVVELEAVKGAKERVRRHLQIAELHERLGDLASAMDEVGRAFLLDPRDETKRATLAELAERTGRLERLADLLVAAAEVCDDNAHRVALTMQAATVRADRIDDATGAISLLSSLLATPRLPHDDLLAAGRKLEPLLETAGRAEEQLDVAERVAGVEPDLALQREALGRAAHLASRLAQSARSISLWEKRLASDERDIEALDGLVDLLEGAGTVERLAEILELRARAAASDAQRRADRVRMAGLLGDVLRRPEDSIAVWREIERDFGESDDGAAALAVLLRTTRRWSELASLLERGGERTADPAIRAELLRQLGDVHREELDASAAAVESYARALSADPGNMGARAGLLALARGEPERAAAVRVLLESLKACDDWRAVLELTPNRLLAASTESDRLAVLVETADIAENRAADTSLAFDAMRRALLIAPGEAQIEREAMRLAEATGAWRELVDSYHQAIDGSAREDRGLVTRLRITAGAILETRLDDPSGALAAYLQVVDEASDLTAGCAAVRVAAKLADWTAAAIVVTDLAAAGAMAPPQLLETYEHAAEAMGSWDEATRALAEATVQSGLAGAAARDVQARIAVWHRDRRADADAAESALERALGHDQGNAGLLTMLVELQRRDPGRPLVDNLLRLSRAAGDDLALLREAAEVARATVDDTRLAQSLLTDLLSLARARSKQEGALGHAEWAIESLAQLHETAGDLRSVVEALLEGDGLPFDPGVHRRMRRRAARIALDGLGDHERAIAIYLALFDADPHDAEAADRLASTYAERGRTRDLLTLRERQIAAASDVAERIALRLVAAALIVELGDAARAAGVLRENLDEDPRHEATVEALAAVLDARGEARELHDLFVDQGHRAEGSVDTARAADMWGRAAVVAEDRLNDAAAAETYHARVTAFEARPASLDALGRLATARADHPAAARWLERLVLVVDGERRVDATMRLADALVGAGEPERAAERLAQAVTEVPDDNPLRERLAALYREKGEWARLASLVTEAAALAPDKPTRLARLLEASRLLSDRCDRADLAIPLLEQASELAPDDQPVRLALADALALALRFDDARSILKSLVDMFGGRRPKERAPVHYQIARLELAMGNRARALVELDTAARVDPQNPDILRSLAELAQSDGQLERAEKGYRALLVVLRRREEGRHVQDLARSEVLLRLSAIAEQQGEGERAREILESALEAAVTGDFEQDRLEAALAARGDHETLARVLEAKLARLGDCPAAAKPLADLAEVLADRLARPEQALQIRLRAVGCEPMSDPAHHAALALARSTGAAGAARYLDGVTALAERAIVLGDAPLACSLLLRLGRVAEEDLEDHARAATFYERAVELGQGTADVLRALDRVFGRLGDTTKQAGALARLVELETRDGGPRAATDAFYRLAALRFENPQTADEGMEMMRKALDLDPQLERAEEALRRAVAVQPTHRGLIDLYERIGREPGHERALVDALRARAQLPGADIETVREAVELAGRLGERTLAEMLLQRTIDQEEPAAEGNAKLSWALEALATLRHAAGDLQNAVELKRAAARIADARNGRRLTLEAARVAAEELGDSALAAEMYEALHRSDPADREVWEPLAAVYRRQGDARKLVDLLASVVDSLDDAKARARLRLERVRAMQELGLNDAEAAPLLREIVDEDANQSEAALMLAAILDRAGSIGELTDLLGRQIDSAKDRGDSASIAALSLRLGLLLERTDPVRARDVYYTGLEWEPSGRDLLDALVRLLQGEADVAERADVLERRLAVEGGPSAEPMAIELSALRAQLGDEAGAERALERGYRSYPASAALGERLEATFRARGEWRKLAELCVLDASARCEPTQQVARLREAATILETKLHDSPGASAALRKARELFPDDPMLLRDHVELLMEAGDPDAALQELSAAIDRLGEADPGRAALLAARGNVRSAMSDEPSALADLEAAFAIDPSAYAQELAGQLERARETSERARDVPAVRALRLRRSQVLAFAGDLEGTRAILVELLRDDPKDRDALRTLANLEETLERWDAASAALKRLVGLEEGERTVETVLRLADACERAGRTGDARGALERALTVSPQERPVRERLAHVYDQTGAWRELADLVLEDARASGDVADRFMLLLRAGSLLLERAGDTAAAIEALEEARALRPLDPECVALMADAYTASGRAEDALALLEPVMAPHKGRRARELAPLHWRVARVARHLGNGADEVRSLVQALDADAQNGRVCSDVAVRAMELEQFELANRALRAITLMKVQGPVTKGLAYQYMGEIARKQGDERRALALFNRALVEDPSLEGARALVDAGR